MTLVSIKFCCVEYILKIVQMAMNIVFDYISKRREDRVGWKCIGTCSGFHVFMRVCDGFKMYCYYLRVVFGSCSSRKRNGFCTKG